MLVFLGKGRIIPKIAPFFFYYRNLIELPKFQI